MISTNSELDVKHNLSHFDLCVLAALISNHSCSQESEMKEKDKRLKLFTEALAGMKILKLYAWESAYEERLLSQRGEELVYIKRYAVLWAWVVMMWCILPFLVSSPFVYCDKTNAH